jgi:hypothetical protein
LRFGAGAAGGDGRAHQQRVQESVQGEFVHGVGSR